MKYVVNYRRLIYPVYVIWVLKIHLSILYKDTKLKVFDAVEELFVTDITVPYCFVPFDWNVIEVIYLLQTLFLFSEVLTLLHKLLS